jgi:hypothetical protein
MRLFGAPSIAKLSVVRRRRTPSSAWSSGMQRREHFQARPAQANGAVERPLVRAERDGAVHVQARVRLDLVGVGHRALERLAQDRRGRAHEEARGQRQRHHDGRLGPHRLLGQQRGIEHAHVADAAFARQPRLQRAVQQRRIEVGVDLDVALHAQRVLLQHRHAADARVHVAQFLLERGDLRVQRHHHRVLRGEAAGEVQALQARIEELGLQVDVLRERVARLVVQADRAVLVAVLVVDVFRLLQLLPELRQLGAQEVHRALGLRRLLVDVLAHVEARDLVEQLGQLRAVAGLPAHVHHAGLLAFLDHAQVALQLEQGQLHGAPRQLEGGAGPGIDGAHQQVDRAARHRGVQRHADAALQRRGQVGVRERVGAVRARGQHEALALEGRRHVHLRDRDPLGARHIAAHAQEARVESPFECRAMNAPTSGR